MRYIFLFISFSLFAQDANKSVEQVLARMNKVRDYRVEAQIKSDIPLIKIMPAKATIYFKQPEKFRMITKGIAILPKKGFTDLTALLRDKTAYNALFTGYEVVNGIKTESLTLLPTDDSGEIVLAKIWVDPAADVILKSQITSRSNGTVLSTYVYGSEKSMGLPSEMNITVDVKKFKIPKGVVVDINRTAVAPANTRKTGQIHLFLTNYIINQGIEDKFFKE
jgi:outer membrane lipoprotein-sorting protein